MTNVITDTEETMNRSASNYTKFTTELMNEGSKYIETQATDSITTASSNMNDHSKEYIEQIQSTTNTLKSSNYEQLVDKQIAKNNQELDEEVTEILVDILK